MCKSECPEILARMLTVIVLKPAKVVNCCEIRPGRHNRVSWRPATRLVLKTLYSLVRMKVFEHRTRQK